MESELTDPLPALPSRRGGSAQVQPRELQVPCDADATPVLPEVPPAEVITIPGDDAEHVSARQLSDGPAAQPQAESAIEPEVGNAAPATPEALRMTPAKRTIDDVDRPAGQQSSSEHQVHNVTSCRTST